MTREDGFTLLEVLLALAIFAVSALTLTSSLGITLRGTAQLRQQQLALWVADNQLIELQLAGTQQPPQDGEDNMAGIDWQWQLTREEGDALIVQRLSVLDGERQSAQLQRYELVDESASDASR